jgi:hypothetical protein
VAPTLPGFTNNYFATNSYDTDYNKYDGKMTWTPNGRMNVNLRLGYADSYEDSAPELPAVDGGINPIFQGRIWDSTVHSHSAAVTSTISNNMVVDGVFGFTRTDMLARPHTDDCWGEIMGIKNSCQAAAVARHRHSDNHGVHDLSPSPAVESPAPTGIPNGAAR